MVEAGSTEETNAAPAQRPRVRPRHAASLILLREGPTGLTVLMGRRGLSARFMPGFYVCPGGRVADDDRDRWSGEMGAQDGAARLDQLARAALRETYEETGILVGRAAGPARQATAAVATPVEAAYRAHGIVPDLALLTFIGRAITPTSSPMRFNTSFFLADGLHAMGAPADSAELDDVAWHLADPRADRSMSGVTRFMLARAIAVWAGDASPPPLYRHIRNRAYVALHNHVDGRTDEPRITKV
jgi:8-oxo-dGTP pyrophosphatase MutT (NUDIX family)